MRGINRDNNDNLYRIAPLHGTVALEQHWQDWRSAFELAWAAPQHDVAAFNDEPTSSCYAVLNFRAGHTFAEHFDVSVVVKIFSTYAMSSISPGSTRSLIAMWPWAHAFRSWPVRGCSVEIQVLTQ